MPTRVLLLRHAETAEPGVFHGAESDVGISERGRRQAAAIAEVIAARSPDRLVSSAMRRARETAEPIGRLCGLPVELEPMLHERRIGRLRGLPTGESDGVWPDTLPHWLEGRTDYASPGAESFDDLQARILPVWRRLTEESRGQTLVVVAHGVVCKVLLLSILPGWSLADWTRLVPFRNVCLTELTDEGGEWRADRLAEDVVDVQ